MARKDVDLVIRARDEAKGTLTAITSALEGFVDRQEDLQRVAGKTDSALDRLGTSLGGLQRALGGVTASGQVAAELERAQSAMTRVAKATEEATGEAIGYEREARKAARATEDLRQQSDKVAAAVEKQSAAVAEARAAQTALNNITAKAAADRRRLAAADEKLTAQIEEQRLKLTLARSAFRELQTEMERTAEPTKRLTTQFGSVGRAVRLAEEKLNELQTTQAVVRTSIDATARATERAQDAFGAQASSVDRQVAALGRLEAKQQEIGQSVGAAASNQHKLEKASESATQSLESQISGLERAEASYREIAAVAGQTETALAGLEAKVRGPLLRAFGEQAGRVKELQQEYAQTSAAATRLGRAIAQSADPSEQMIAAFTRSQEAAARAREEYRQQNGELAELRRILRETGGDVDAFASRQQRAKAILERAGAAFHEYTAASRRAAAEDAKVNAEARRAAAGVGRYSGALRDNSAAARRAAASNRSLAGAIRGFYGESRTALSFTQRLRSEVLALIAAYGGFFAVIEGVRNVVDAYQSLEAAQSRLNVVFEGNKVETAKELDFIRRQAERLGIEFGTLAKEYTKFAVATKGTNLEGAETRRIFVSVAEAGRVNKASLQELQGVFVALSQIVSKGSVQMEELRQQLGDRLPGALQIMADGIGVSTAELIKMMEAGEVSADRLSEFADELDRRFGSQVPAALQTTTTAIGKFQNALFQAFLRVAEGGFIDAFTDLVNDLAETLGSAQFESFLDRMSVALAGLSDALAFTARNFDILAAAILAFIGLKLAPFVILLVAKLGLLTGSTVSTARGFRALSVAVNSGAVSMSRAAIAARALSIAMRGLLSSTGIGLLVVGIGAAIGAWVTRTDKATEALNTHEKILDRVRNAYDEVGNAVDDWREKVEDLTVSEAQRNLQNLQKALRDTQRAFVEAARNVDLRFFTKTSTRDSVRDELETLARGFISGGITIDQLDAGLLALEKRYEGVASITAEWRADLIQQAKELGRVTQATNEARDVLVAKTGADEEAQRALDRLSGALEENADATEDNAERLEKYNAALEKLGEFVPDIKKELEDFKEAADLKEAFQSALQLANTYEEMLDVFTRYAEARKALETDRAMDVFEGAAGGGMGAAAALIKEFEGWQPTGKWDVNAFRAGFGSDTIRLADETVVKITEGMAVTYADAQRDLIHRIGEFQDGIIDRIGKIRWEAFSAEQQAVLTSIAYNYGSLPGRIIEAVRSGSVEEIAAAIRTLRDDNEGVNRDRRDKEALIFEGAGTISDQALIDAREESLKLAEKEAEKRAEARKDTEQRIADLDFELEQQRRINAEKEREAEIEAAIREAKEKDPEITADEIESIRARTGELFDLKLAEDIAEEREREAKATAETLENLEFEVGQQRLINAEKLREAAIEAAVKSARSENANISERELALVRERAGLLFDLQHAEENARKPREEAEKRVNDLLAVRQALLEQLTFLLENGGDAEAVHNLRVGIEGINEQLVEAIDHAIELFQAFADGNPEIQATIEKLKMLKLTAQQSTGDIVVSWKEVEKVLSDNIANAMDMFAQKIAQGKNVTESLHTAFLQFAADFLRQIARMIMQQIALNAAKMIGKALGFGIAHEGGIIGAQTARRSLNPAAFAGALRYHTGGIAGLQPGEVPTILRRGEEVLTEDDPRHAFNLGKGGGGGESSGGVSIINAFDAESFLEEALSSPRGSQIVMNWMSAKKGAIGATLGGRARG